MVFPAPVVHMARAARGSNAAMAEPDFYMPHCYLYILSRPVIVLQHGLCVAFPSPASSFLFPEVGPISGTATTYLAISAPLANSCGGSIHTKYKIYLLYTLYSAGEM